jgi:hypothetical protein
MASEIVVVVVVVVAAADVVSVVVVAPLLMECNRDRAFSRFALCENFGVSFQWKTRWLTRPDLSISVSVAACEAGRVKSEDIPSSSRRLSIGSGRPPSSSSVERRTVSIRVSVTDSGLRPRCLLALAWRRCDVQRDVTSRRRSRRFRAFCVPDP